MSYFRVLGVCCCQQTTQTTAVGRKSVVATAMRKWGYVGEPAACRGMILASVGLWGRGIGLRMEVEMQESFLDEA